MVKGLAVMDRRFLQRHPDHDAQTKKRIDGAVELFLNGCRALGDAFRRPQTAASA